jgi:DDE family transposase
MKEFSQLFEGVSDPRRSNAARHDLHEMLMIALLCVLCGGEGCHDMSLFGRSKERFLRRFMVLAHGIPSHDAFSDLFNALDPKSFQPVMLRLLGDFARNLGVLVEVPTMLSLVAFANRKNRSFA